MKKTDKEIAAILVRDNAPKLSTKEVADLVNINPVTLRSWPTRGFIQLDDSDPGSTGRGKSIMFGPLDVVKIMACADMTRLSIPPSLLTADFADMVTTEVLKHLHTIAGNQLIDEKGRNRVNALYDARIQSQIERGAPNYLIEQANERRQKSLNPVAERYYEVFYSRVDKRVWSMPFEKEMPEAGGMFSDSVHLVFDCLDIADKLIKAYRKYLGI